MVRSVLLTPDAGAGAVLSAELAMNPLLSFQPQRVAISLRESLAVGGEKLLVAAGCESIGATIAQTAPGQYGQHDVDTFRLQLGRPTEV